MPGHFENAKGARTFDAAARFKPDAECYYYRSTGKGFVIDFQGKTHPTPGTGVNYDYQYLKGLPPGCGASW